MLFKETVEKPTLELLTLLMKDKAFENFVLVGGTALALQLGHRISIDIDLFSDSPFNHVYLADHLRTTYSFELDFISENTLKGEIRGIKFDCISHQYPWLEQNILLENIRMASLTDVAAMKLNAITGNGTRIKDFIDIAHLSARLSLNHMLHGYAQKYNSNQLMPLKAIVYYDDINFNEPIKMAGKHQFRWEAVKNRIQMMHNNPDKVFSPL